GSVVELLDYRLFSHLSQTLHFGRAARGLGMSPSALTRRVQAIEDEVGQQLFVRDHREVKLTAAGQRFRTFVRTHLDQWDQLQNELREEANAPTGTLHLACTVTAAHTVLPRLLSKFRFLYPGVTWALVTQDATRSLSQLEAGEVDLAVIPTDDDPPASLARVVLGRTDLTFIGPKELGPWKESLEKRTPDLTNVPLIAPIAGLERKRLDGRLKAHHETPRI